MNTQPLLRSPNTEGILSCQATDMIARVSRALWYAVVCYNLEHPRVLPATVSQATVTLYNTLVLPHSLAEQTRCLSTLVEELGQAPRWIACAHGIDMALGQAERFLRFAVLEETEQK